MEWVVVLGGIFAYDAWLIRSGRESLSSIYDRRLHNPVTGPFVAGATVVLVAHLAGSRLPPCVRRLDPIAAAGRQLRR
jgi:hypothetical protein